MAPLFIGLDAGGTATRWVAMDADGLFVAEGQCNGVSGLHIANPDKRSELLATLQSLAAAVCMHGRVQAIYAGVTGISDPHAALTLELNMLIADAFGVPRAAVACHSDMDVAYRAAFDVGRGVLVYAGTGSIATYRDPQGALHRAGGLGYALGDEGGGYWIAKEALAAIWRREDDQPGSWKDSPLANAVFAHLGSSDWATTRHFVYGSDRGVVGRLALAVAQAAHQQDAQASALLHRAGLELGRLAAVLRKRFGPMPVTAAGRVLLLHPLVGEGLAASLPADCPLTLRQLQPHHAAARRALALFQP